MHRLTNFVKTHQVLIREIIDHKNKENLKFVSYRPIIILTMHLI